MRNAKSKPKNKITGGAPAIERSAEAMVSRAERYPNRCTRIDRVDRSMHRYRDGLRLDAFLLRNVHIQHTVLGFGIHALIRGVIR